jgi:hypothetical protein
VIGYFEPSFEQKKAYVVFGKKGLGSAGSIDLRDINGTNGFVLNADRFFSYSFSVSAAGDVNDDGVDDLLIGVSMSGMLSLAQAGKCYVLFGRTGLGSNGTVQLSSLDGREGFALEGERMEDYLGSVAKGGDVNGDGIADLVIGAPGADPNEKSTAGKVYVIFGAKGLGSNGNFALSSLDGTNGFVLNGAQAGYLTGSTVAGSGDVNGDGVDDLFMTSLIENLLTPSKVYVVFGRKLATPIPPTVKMATNARITNSTTLTSIPSSSNSNPSSLALPVIIGIATGVAALACIILGGGLYCIKRKLSLHAKSIEQDTGMKDSEGVAMGYVSADTRPQTAVSSQVSSGYLNEHVGAPRYSNPSDVRQPKENEQYNQVSLAQLNTEISQH